MFLVCFFDKGINKAIYLHIVPVSDNNYTNKNGSTLHKQNSGVSSNVSQKKRITLRIALIPSLEGIICVFPSLKHGNARLQSIFLLSQELRNDQ